MENNGEGSPLAYKLMLSCPSGLPPSQVFVDFDKKYDRIPHPDANMENSLAEIWDTKAQQNPSLYNGTKFRYDGHAVFAGEDGQDAGVHVFLHLGLTDYRTFMGTNLNPSWEKFLVQTADETIRCQHTANPLGNGAVVETSDGRILVLKRSNIVGEFPGHFVFPGGHPEPEEVGIVSHQSSDPKLLNGQVAQEMFDSIIREVVEETGVPAESLKDPVFIGISRRELNVRPTSFFFMKCTLQSNEIQKLYDSAQDSFESTQLYAVSKDELENLSSKMPGCHHGGFVLYKLMLEAVKSK